MVIDKILFITLSNIGDVILTLPALDYLKTGFPQAKITVIVGPRPKEIFENDSSISRIIVFDKQAKLRRKIKLFNELKKEKFDFVVDLRNSLLGYLIPAQYKIFGFGGVPKYIKHMKDRHLYKIKNLPTSRDPDTVGKKSKIKYQKEQTLERKSLHIKQEDEEYINNILAENDIRSGDEIIVISAGARSDTKRWAKEKFVELINKLGQDYRLKIILAGDKQDILINKYIKEQSSGDILDLAGKTTLPQLGFLLKQSRLLIANDSAVLHIASYFNIPIAAIFGITNELKYGPWSDSSIIVKKDIFCRPCEKAQCPFGSLECMRLIRVEDVLRQVRNVLVSSHQSPVTSCKEKFKRILVIRTDRIGDVLLSTPVIKALRDNYPYAYIAMMVSAYSKDIVDGNPYLDEVIIYDKDGRHKSWFSSLKFAFRLKKRKFDLAVILHPVRRVHLISFFAGIPRRVGYDRKFGFLLTDKIKHRKQLGEKHELEYNLEMLNSLGIEAKDKALFMPIRPESEDWLKELLSRAGIKENENLLVIHPAASCPSKIWPAERFAQAADKLIERYAFKVLVVAGAKDTFLAENVVEHMRYAAVNLAGKTSVSQLASILKRAILFISNDSGPVHIASAVGTPVISIFGRSQKGLSPKRWGPLGLKDRILHKEAGCIECLAHNCNKGFICLKAITVEDVLKTVDSIMDEAGGDKREIARTQ
ncbi:MAG: lipopolysaccharide heptosyltransferase II [Candidatus Omnitrophota bacterium]